MLVRQKKISWRISAVRYLTCQSAGRPACPQQTGIRRGLGHLRAAAVPSPAEPRSLPEEHAGRGSENGSGPLPECAFIIHSHALVFLHYSQIKRAGLTEDLVYKQPLFCSFLFIFHVQFSTE